MRHTNPYKIYLALTNIEHRRTKVRHTQTNGFVERFNRPALDEFFRKALREKSYSSTEELQAHFDNWLGYCNNERPHRGYRNMGKRPIETVNQYLGTLGNQEPPVVRGESQLCTLQG